MKETSFDLIVVGGGPGGYVAAIRAAQLGLRTALVEREHLGGICLNWGCIPTKALLRTSEIYHLMQHAGDFGLSADNVSFDIGKVVKRSRRVAGRLNAGVRHLMKKNKVAVFDGHGRLAGKGKVAVVKDGKETATLSSPQIILATGARARTLPGLEPDGKDIWTYKEAMVPEDLPEISSDRRQRRHRHRVRQLLPHAGRRGDGRRDARPHPAGRGRGNLRLRAHGSGEAGHDRPDRRDGSRAR